MRRRLLKIGAWAMGLFFGLLLLIYLGLVGGLSTGAVNQLVKAKLKGVVSGEVRFGSVSTNIFSTITLKDFQVLSVKDGVKLPVVVMDRLTVHYRLWALLLKGIDWTDDVRLIRIEGLRIFLVRDMGEKWNVVQLLGPLMSRTRERRETGKKAPLPIVATEVELVDSVIALHDQKKGFLSTLSQINGSLDSRDIPKVHFFLGGRTEEAARPNVKIDGDLLLDEGKIQFKANLDQVPLAQYLNYLFPPQGVRFTRGTADLRLEALASGNSLDLKGRAALKGARVVIPGVADPLENLEGEVRFSRDRLEFEDLSARFLGSNWRAGGSVENLLHPRLDLFMENPSLELPQISRNFSLQALDLTGTAQLGVSITGSAVDPLIAGWLRSDSLGAKGMVMQGFETKVKMRGRTVELQELKARVLGGVLEGRGLLELPSKNKAQGGQAGTLSAQLKLASMNLDDLSGLGLPYFPFHGNGDIDFDLSGSLKEPKIGMVFTVPDFYLGAQDLGPLALKSTWYRKYLDFNLIGFKDTFLVSGGVSRTAGTEFNKVRFSLKQFDIGAMAQGIADAQDKDKAPPVLISAAGLVYKYFHGHLTAEASLDGPLDDPRFMGMVSIPDGHFRVAGEDPDDPRLVALHSTLKGKLEYVDGVLRLGRDQDPLELSFSHKNAVVRVSGKGTYQVKAPSASPLNYALKMTGDMGILTANPRFTAAQGSLDANLSVTGNPASPQVAGRLDIANFRGKMNKYLDEFQEGRLTLIFENRTFTVKDFHLKSGGVIEGDGELLLAPNSFPLGRVSLHTDKLGIKIANWDEMGSGYLVLDPLTFEYNGGSQPAVLSGRVLGHDLTIYYGGRKKKEVLPAENKPSPGPGLSWPEQNLDLRLALGENVWYQSSLGDRLAAANLAELTQSLLSFLKSPAFQIQLKPTENDFRIYGPLKDLSLSGELAIKRGIVTYQNNDFNIKEGSVQFKAVPSGTAGSKRRGDMTAVAEYATKVVDKNNLDPSGRTQMKSVIITLNINPLSESAQEENGTQNNFLNFYPSFSAQPPFYSDPDKNMKAIASVLFFGEDLTGEAEGTAVVPGAGTSAASQPAPADSGRILGGVFSKYLGGVVNFFSRGASNTVGRFFFDYFRVTPGLKLASSGPAAAAPVAGAVSQEKVSQQIQQSGMNIDNVKMDAGKSLPGDLFVSAQGVYTINPDPVYANGILIPEQEVQQGWNGGRLGGEWKVGSNKQLEAYANYRVDDNLDPIPPNPDDPTKDWSYSLLFRASLSNQTYGRFTSLRRKMQLEAKNSKK